MEDQALSDQGISWIVYCNLRRRVTSSLEVLDNRSQSGDLIEVHFDSLTWSISKEYSDRSTKRKVREFISSSENPKLNESSFLSSGPLLQLSIPIVLIIFLSSLLCILRYCCDDDTLTNCIVISLLIIAILMLRKYNNENLLSCKNLFASFGG